MDIKRTARLVSVISVLVVSTFCTLTPLLQAVPLQKAQPVSRGTTQPSHIIGCLPLFPSTDEAPNRVEVRQNANSTGPSYTVYFIGGWPNTPKTLYRYFEYWAGLVDMFFAGGRNNLVIEWEAGDRPVVQVFHLDANGARLVFSKGSRGGAEYWGGVILLDDAAIGSDGNYHFTATELWQWNGNQFKLVATVPYAQRLEALAKLEHKGTKK